MGSCRGGFYCKRRERRQVQQDEDASGGLDRLREGCKAALTSELRGPNADGHNASWQSDCAQTCSSLLIYPFHHPAAHT